MPKMAIEEMAMRHLMRHPNDKSYSWLSKMNGTYGREAAKQALKDAAQVMLMADPTNPNLSQSKAKITTMRRTESMLKTGDEYNQLIFSERLQIWPLN